MAAVRKAGRKILGMAYWKATMVANESHDAFSFAHPPMKLFPQQTCYTLSCDELRLVVEFALNHGEFGRIGSSPYMEISLPLVGLAEMECKLSLDESGVLWLVREGEQQAVPLDPPCYFRAGPYRFLVKERVDVPTIPAPTQVLATNPWVEAQSHHQRSRASKTAIAFAVVGSVAAAIWITVPIASDRQTSNPSETPTNGVPPKHDLAQKHPSGPATPATPHPEEKAEPTSETIKTSPAGAPHSPPDAETPNDPDKFDLERLAKLVGPCVFLVEVIDESGTFISSGTAFAVSSDGLVTTSFHVVEHGVKFVLVTQQGARFDNARVVVEDPPSDLAILKIEAKDLPYLKLAATSEVPVGKRVAVFGSPKGLGGTLSEGIISATPRDLKERLVDELLPNGGVLLQTTAPVSSGSSGSPLFDSTGEVIGIISNGLRGADQPQNLNFAVPVEALKPLLPESGFQRSLLRRQRPEAETSAPSLKPRDASVFDETAAAPLSDPAYLELRAKIERKEWVEAMKQAGTLLERYPNSAHVLFAHACCASALRLDRQAEQSYLKVLEIVPTEAAVWHHLGVAISCQKQTERALLAFEMAVTLEPDRVASWKQIVIGNVVLENWPKATTALNTMDQIDPAEARELSRFFTRYRVDNAAFRQAMLRILSNQPIQRAKDGPHRVRVVGVAANDTLSVRSGPGATFPIVTAAANRSEMFVTGPSEFNGSTEWVPVEYGNWSGWVARKFVAPVD
jgi:S1-C subfamily serine protease